MAAFTTLTSCHCQATTLHSNIEASHFHKQNQNVYYNCKNIKTIHKAKSSLLSYHLFTQTKSTMPLTHFSTSEVVSVQDLSGFICAGPLIDKVGLTQEKVAESIDKWLFYGSKLCRLFQLNELYLIAPQRARFYHYNTSFLYGVKISIAACFQV